MEMNKEKLLNSFQELYSIEVKARDYYAGLLKQDIPKKDRRVISEIWNDEKRHMKIAMSIIKIINSDRKLK